MQVLIAAKITGCVCVGLASWLVGNELERKIKMQDCMMREWKELFSFLLKEMIHRRSPVETALVQAAGNCRTCMREFLLAVSEEVALRGGKEFRTLWREQLLDTVPVDLFTQEQYELICESAAALGGTDTVMQKQLLETYAERFEQQSELTRQIYREKSVLYRRLSTAAGIFLMILFI